jgi:hypothetical protein
MTYTHLIRTTVTSLALACAAGSLHAGPVSDVGYTQNIAFFKEGVAVEGCGAQLNPPPGPPKKSGTPPPAPVLNDPNAMHGTLTLNKDYTVTLVALNPGNSPHLQLSGSWYPVPGNHPAMVLQIDGTLSTAGSTGSWKTMIDNMAALSLSQCQSKAPATTFTNVIDASVRLLEARLDLHGDALDRGALFIQSTALVDYDANSNGGGRTMYRAVGFGPVTKF